MSTTQHHPQAPHHQPPKPTYILDSHVHLWPTSVANSEAHSWLTVSNRMQCRSSRPLDSRSQSASNVTRLKALPVCRPLRRLRATALLPALARNVVIEQQLPPVVLQDAYSLWQTPYSIVTALRPLRRMDIRPLLPVLPQQLITRGRVEVVLWIPQP